VDLLWNDVCVAPCGLCPLFSQEQHQEQQVEVEIQSSRPYRTLGLFRFASQPIEFLIIRPTTAGEVVIVSEADGVVVPVTHVHATVDALVVVASVVVENVTNCYSPGGILTRTFVNYRTDNVILVTKVFLTSWTVFLTGWTVFLTGWVKAYMCLADWARINVSFDDWART
jgi:hypothetical protein